MSEIFETARQAVDLSAVAGQYTTLNRSKNGPCPICGGRDRFYIHKGGQRWGCRGCTPSGGDVIDLVCRVEKVAPIEAVRRLLGQSIPITTPRTNQPPKAREMAWSARLWQESARKAIEAGRSALRPLSTAADYLSFRDIETATADAFSIGAATKQGRPAILLPWLDSQRRCTALKYRFVDEQARVDKHKRFTQKVDSESIIFGAHLVTGSSDTLVVVEGEFNCLTIWQASRSRGWHVLSLGSDRGSKGLAFLPRLMERNSYTRVVTWFDIGERARSVAAVLPGAIPMQSPRGLDANDILVRYGASALLGIIDAIKK